MSAFESTTCGRCGGSGHYSWCQMYGSTCFGCAGAGRKMTKRGAVARAFYLSLLPQKRAADLLSGDVVLDDNGRRKIVVQEIRPTTTRAWVNNVEIMEPRLDIVTRQVVLCGVYPDTIFPIAPTTAQRDDAIAKAVAYQATLTKRGTPRKTRAATEIAA